MFPRIAATTYRMKSGFCWSRIDLDAGVRGAVLPKITADLSMQCSGYCERARRGAICRRTMAAGATRTAVLSVGVTRAFGKNCWRF